MANLNPFKWLNSKVVAWLIKERPPSGSALMLCDFNKLSYEVRPCDVLLIEGRSRVSEVIKALTQSTWSHAALYIGRLHDISDPKMRAKILQAYPNITNEQLVVESLLGHGTIIVPLTKYEGDHIRICRPKGILPQDADQVIYHMISRLGAEYDVRHILDLARMFVPIRFLPRRWRSSLFNPKASQATREICSSMIAEAFLHVRFPVLPYWQKHESKGIELIPRNPRLFTPSDFDYSPYFEIIKYPIFQMDTGPIYRSLPWNEEGIVSHDTGFGSLDQALRTDHKKKLKDKETGEIKAEEEEAANQPHSQSADKDKQTKDSEVPVATSAEDKKSD